MLIDRFSHEERIVELTVYLHFSGDTPFYPEAAFFIEGNGTWVIYPHSQIHLADNPCLPSPV